MFNLDELVHTEELQINGEVLHIKPILKGFADRYRAKTMLLGKKIKSKKVEMSDITEMHKLVIEYLSNNTDERKFSLKDLDNLTEIQINALIKHIGEEISNIEKK